MAHEYFWAYINYAKTNLISSVHMGFIQQDEMARVSVDDPRIDFTLKLLEGFALDKDDERPVAGPSNTLWD